MRFRFNSRVWGIVRDLLVFCIMYDLGRQVFILVFINFRIFLFQFGVYVLEIMCLKSCNSGSLKGGIVLWFEYVWKVVDGEEVLDLFLVLISCDSNS